MRILPLFFIIIVTKSNGKNLLWRDDKIFNVVRFKVSQIVIIQVLRNHVWGFSDPQSPFENTPMRGIYGSFFLLFSRSQVVMKKSSNDNFFRPKEGIGWKIIIWVKYEILMFSLKKVDNLRARGKRNHKFRTQMPQNLSAQFVCPSSKLLDFNEKKLHLASVVRN